MKFWMPSTGISWRAAMRWATASRRAVPDTDPEADRRFDLAFEELMALARAHFAAEEALLAARGFDGLDSLRNEVEEFDFLAAEIVTTRTSTGRNCKPSSASGGPGMSPAPPASIGPAWKARRRPERGSAGIIRAWMHCSTASNCKPATRRALP
jgi:hypothetical protein